MRAPPRPFLVLGFMFLMAVLWIAHDPPDPTTARALKDAETRLKEFYRGYPLPPGWRMAGVSVDNRRGEVWADLRLAGEAAAALKAKPGPAVADAVARHCPPRSDVMWQILRPRQELEIRAAGDDGGVIIAVNCRAQGPK